MMDEVILAPATPADSVLLGNLLEHYAHDMSEFLPIDIGPDGRFGYAKLPLYWSEPEKRFPFLIRRGTAVVGFVLATLGSPATEDPRDFDVAEFFVLRRHRRSGIGERAATLLWDSHPGRWIVRVSEGNRAGLSFWSRIINAYTGGKFSATSRPAAPHGWRVFSFYSAGG
jgi:predicted acetyltransferase